MRTVATLAVVVVLGACSKSTDRSVAGVWAKHTLADGRLSFEMPGPAEHERTAKQQGPDTLDEERAACDNDDRHYSVSVTAGKALAKRMGTTEKEHVRWAGFHIVGIVQGEEERSIVDEGKWTQGPLVGKWMQLALPEKPPQRKLPVYRWLYAAAWEGKAVLVGFSATQAAYDDDVDGPAVEQARERFVASVTVE